MKSVKSTAIASILGLSVLSTSVLAGVQPFQDVTVPPEKSVTISAQNSDKIFDMSAKSTQLVALSQKEMKETEGAWVNWAVGGAVGGAGYAWGVYRGNYSWNTTRFIGNVATGALIGGTFGAAGAAAGGGLSVGANVWRANSFISNWGVNHGWRR